MERPIRFLLSRDEGVAPSGDWIVASSLRDAGFEVILGGPQTPENAAEAALEEGPDLVGYGISAGSAVEPITRLLARMRELGIGELSVVVGASLGGADVVALRELGVDEVFDPFSRLDEAIRRFRGLGFEARSRAHPA